MKSRDKLKSLYLHYHHALDHKTSQNGDLPWVSLTHKVTQPFGYVVLWDHLAN